MENEKETSFLEDLKSLWFCFFIAAFIGFVLGIVIVIFGTLSFSSKESKKEESVEIVEEIEEVKEEPIDIINIKIPDKYYRTENIFSENEELYNEDNKIKLYVDNGPMKGILEFKVLSAEYVSANKSNNSKYYNGFYSFERKYILAGNMTLYILKDSPDRVILIFFDEESDPLILEKGDYEVL